MNLRISMPRAAAIAASLTLSSVLVAQSPAPPGAGAPFAPRTFDTSTGQRITVTQVAGGLVHPYSIAFPDAHTMLVAERSGRVRVIKDGALLPKPAWEAPPAPAGSPGPANGAEALHFIELHPSFAQNHLV